MNSAFRSRSIHFRPLIIGVISIFEPTFGSAQVTSSFTEPVERIEVSAAEFGIVTAIKVKEGDRVAKGQLLGKLNIGVLQESLRLAKARAESTGKVDVAQSNVKLKKSIYDKLQPLTRLI
jgi:multidrug efflux pump subunit AcrA (membrane-fusion protein)